MTVTVKVHCPGQPSRVILSVKVNEPAAPAVTLTEAPVVEPLMVPLPLIDQLCVTVPPAGLTAEVYVCVVPVHTGLSPVMLQVGVGLMGTVKVHCPGQPSRVTLSVRVNEPEAPAVTLTDAPVVEPLIVPLPLIDQLWVTVPPAGSTVEV